MSIQRLLLVLAAGASLAARAAAATCDVTAFGADADGKTLATAAIQRAIDACRDQGGGRVVVPAGVFVTGTLRLHSRIELHLEAGAVLRGSANVADYQLDGRRARACCTPSGSRACRSPAAARSTATATRSWTARRRSGSAPRSCCRRGRRSAFAKSLLGSATGPYVPRDRPFQTIIFSACRDVTLEDVTIVNAPFWAVHFADCDSVRVRGIRLFNDLMVPNGDGIDFTSCRNVVVSDCDIRAGDDALVVHRLRPSLRPARLHREDATTPRTSSSRTARSQSRSSAIRVGGYDQNSMRRYAFSNIVIHELEPRHRRLPARRGLHRRRDLHERRDPHAPAHGRLVGQRRADPRLGGARRGDRDRWGASRA